MSALGSRVYLHLTRGASPLRSYLMTLAVRKYIWIVVVACGCSTQSHLVTDPSGLHASLNGIDCGRTPCEIRSVGTTFGEYRLFSGTTRARWSVTSTFQRMSGYGESFGPPMECSTTSFNSSQVTPSRRMYALPARRHGQSL